MNAVLPLWFIPAFPLAGALVLGIIALAAVKTQGANEAMTSFLAVVFPGASFVVTVMLAAQLPQGFVLETPLATWFSVPGITVQWGFLFDDLARIMLLFVTGIGTLIVLYSVGYMHKDRGFVRFMAYLQLFLFSMIVLVLSNSLPLTFLGWEGVGLCSYLLIGFWHTKAENSQAANKAFIVNRVGDVGFLLGMFTLISLGGAEILRYTQLSEWAAAVAAQGLMQDTLVFTLVTLACLLLLWGCTGKSAQIPLLTWLPDAMAGPTPVSALIHAATMVTAGVYLLVRLSGLFVLSPVVLTIVTIMGLATALWAAVAGLVQKDIKKVLAYSTISQLGFMFLAVGVAAFDVAVFHVFTHAFFKAALFLGAGAVIHALGGEQNLYNMGGLARRLPGTFFVMLLAWAAIVGLPGFAGFWSKDLILERVFNTGAWGLVFYALALLTAVLTAVYMTRLMLLIFGGTYRGERQTWEHAHEAPASMQIAMWILAVGCVLAGYVWAGLIPGWNWLGHSLAAVVHQAQTYYAAGLEKNHLMPWLGAVLSTTAAVIGIFLASLFYRRGLHQSAESTELRGPGRIWTLAFDALHTLFGIWPARLLALLFAGINVVLLKTQWTLAQLPEITGDGLKVLQQGRVRVQVALSMIGALLLTVVIIWGVR